MPNPAFDFSVDGVSIDFQGRVVAITITDETPDRFVTEVSNTLEIVLDDSLATRLAMPERGRLIVGKIGWAGAPLYDVGTFFVDEVAWETPPDRLVIRAQSNPKGMINSPYAKLTTRQERSFDYPSTIGQIATIMAKESGVEISIAPKYVGIIPPKVHQANQADWDLIIDLGLIYGGGYRLEAGKLIIYEKGTGKTNSGQSTPVTKVTRAVTGQLLDPTLNYASRLTSKFSDFIKYKTVTARYHDFDSANDVQVSAGDGTDPTLMLTRPFPDKATALAAANTALTACDRRIGEIGVTIPGQPLAAAEGVLNLQGFRDEVDDDWCIRRVTHRITKDEGFVTEIEANRLAVDAIADAASETD